jgi:hypothetical protein
MPRLDFPTAGFCVGAREPPPVELAEPTGFKAIIYGRKSEKAAGDSGGFFSQVQLLMAASLIP